jgi:hypothetical protein
VHLLLFAHEVLEKFWGCSVLFIEGISVRLFFSFLILSEICPKLMQRKKQSSDSAAYIYINDELEDFSCYSFLVIVT